MNVGAWIIAFHPLALCNQLHRHRTLHRERTMIRIFIRDKRWGEVEVVNGKIHVVDDNGTLEGLINSPCLRHDEYGKELTDQEVYDSLPVRVNGQVWARRVDS
jgi:hypothetical protein